MKTMTTIRNMPTRALIARVDQLQADLDFGTATGDTATEIDALMAEYRARTACNCGGTTTNFHLPACPAWVSA